MYDGAAGRYNMMDVCLEHMWHFRMRASNHTDSEFATGPPKLDGIGCVFAVVTSYMDKPSQKRLTHTSRVICQIHGTDYCGPIC